MRPRLLTEWRRVPIVATRTVKPPGWVAAGPSGLGSGYRGTGCRRHLLQGCPSGGCGQIDYDHSGNEQKRGSGIVTEQRSSSEFDLGELGELVNGKRLSRRSLLKGAAAMGAAAALGPIAAACGGDDTTTDASSSAPAAGTPEQGWRPDGRHRRRLVQGHGRPAHGLVRARHRDPVHHVRGPHRVGLRHEHDQLAGREHRAQRRRHGLAGQAARRGDVARRQARHGRRRRLLHGPHRRPEGPEGRLRRSHRRQGRRHQEGRRPDGRVPASRRRTSCLDRGPRRTQLPRSCRWASTRRTPSAADRSR